MRNRSLFAIAMTLALSACGSATQVGFSDPAARSAALEKFHSGTAAMTCGTGFDCTFKWINSRAAAQRFAQAQRWDDVADVVLAAGMDVDLAWFYLGLAAQGENRTSAARVYYNMSVRKTLAGSASACGSVNTDNCLGVDLPDDANRMMAQLRGGGSRAAAPRPRTTAPVAAATPASTGWVAPAPASSGSSSSFVTPAPAASTQSGGGWVAPAASKP